MSWAPRLKSWGNELSVWLDGQIESVRANPTPTIVALAWFAFTYASTVWVWGINPKVFFAPDESLNRLAAGILAKRGQPFMGLPFPDPEDLAHPRHWVTLGNRAIPSYAPVSIYGYALLLRLHGLGWVTALPAMATAAFAAGLARLLPRGRQWLALPAPLLGFPALYWLTRPWMNLSVLLICICWAFFFWATWRRDQRPIYLAIAIGWVGTAAAVRPDYAAYLMTVALLLGLGQAPHEWRRIVTFVLVSGAGAVLVNLFLNWLVTGHPTVAAYQIVAARDEGPSAPSGLLTLLTQLTLPMGVPTLSVLTRSLSKYWLKMGPISGILLSLPALGVVLWRQKKPQLALQLAAIFVIAVFVLSRMDPDLNGASDRRGWVDHSMPRYWSPVYLLATVPIALAFAKLKNRVLFGVAAAALIVLGLAGARHIWFEDNGCFVKTRTFVERNEEALKHVKAKIPQSAYVYTVTHDKILWPYWRLGTIALDEPDRSAQSMRRAFDAGLEVFVYETQFGRPRYLRLQEALHQQQIRLARVSWSGIYRVRRYKPPPPQEPEPELFPEDDVDLALPLTRGAAPVEAEPSGDLVDAPASDEVTTRPRRTPQPFASGRTLPAASGSVVPPTTAPAP